MPADPVKTVLSAPSAPEHKDLTASAAAWEEWKTVLDPDTVFQVIHCPMVRDVVNNILTPTGFAEFCQECRPLPLLRAQLSRFPHIFSIIYPHISSINTILPQSPLHIAALS